MALIDAIQAKHHTPTLNVTIAGTVITPLSVSVELGWDIANSTCRIRIPSNLVNVQFRQQIVVQAGFNGFYDYIFKGFVEDVNRSYFPADIEILGCGYLKLTQYDFALVVDNQAVGIDYSGLNMTDIAVIQDMLFKSGVTQFTTLDLQSVNYGTITFGTNYLNGPSGVQETPVGAPLWRSISEIDQVYLCHTFDARNGVVTRRFVPANPTTGPSFTYSEGDANWGFFSISRPRSMGSIHNQINLTGNQSAVSSPGGAVSVQWPLVLQATNVLVPDPPGFDSLPISTQWVESAPLAQEPGGILANLISYYNRQTEQIEVEIPGNPLINPADIIGISSSDVGISTTNYWVQHVSHTIDEKGFVTKLKLMGGPAGGNILASEAPPVAVISNFRVVQEGTPSLNVTPQNPYTPEYDLFADGTQSYSPVYPFNQLAFEWTFNGITIGTGVTVGSQTSWGDFNIITSQSKFITLIVTDPQGHQGSASVIVNPPPNPIYVPNLYVAASSVAEATPDGGSNWRQWPGPGGGATVLSTPPIAPIGFSLFGCSNGGLYKDANHLATAPTLVNTFPAAVNAIWIGETNSQLLSVGLANGDFWYSSTQGSSWSKLHTFSGAVNEVAEDINGNFYAATGSQLLISTDGGATWTAVADLGSGGVAQRLSLSNFGRYVSGDNGSLVVRDDGTAISFPSVSPAPAHIRGLTHDIRTTTLYAGDDQGRTYAAFGTLSPPPTPVVSVVESGGSIGAGTYKIVNTYVTASGGETTPSNPAQVVCVGGACVFTVQSPPDQGSGSLVATGWNTYSTLSNGSTYYKVNP